MTSLQFALRSLSVVCATFYLSYVIVHTGGPFGLFASLRAPHRHFDFSHLLGCIYCIAPYVALLLWIATQTPYLAWLVDVFAVAGAALLLFRYTGGSHT